MSRSQTRMLPAGTPAAFRPSTIVATTAWCVAPDAPPVAEILIPTMSFGSTRLRQAAATESLPVVATTSRSTIERTRALSVS